MLAPLLMVPAPCPLHLRPGGGARPARRPGEPPPPRAGPAATRRCGRPRGRGAAGVAAEEEPQARRAPSRPVPSRGPGGAAGLWGCPAPAVCVPRRSEPALAAASESVHRSVRGLAPSEPLRSTRRAPGVEGTAHRRRRPPRPGSSAAATPRSPAPPLGPAPPARSRPSRIPGGPHPLPST